MWKIPKAFSSAIRLTSMRSLCAGGAAPSAATTGGATDGDASAYPQAQYQPLLLLRAGIRRSDRVYAMDVNHTGSKLLLASRDRLISMYELDIDEEIHGDHALQVGVEAASATSEIDLQWEKTLEDLSYAAP